MRSHRLLAVVPLMLLVACSEATGDAAAPAPAPAAPSGEIGIRFTIDGTAYTIADDDILTSHYASGELKVFAGPDGGRSLVLTIPDVAQCPCEVPAGSTTPGDPIAQGSLSLQNHPNAGNALNNWYLGQDGTPPPAAITVTDIGTVQDGTRIVSGTFATTVLRTDSNGDGPENRDYVLRGEFRLRHETDPGAAF